MIAASVCNGIAHLFIVEGQQAHIFFPEEHPIAVFLQHGECASFHIKNSRAALAAVRGQEELHRQCAALRVKSRQLQQPQVKGQHHSVALSAADALPVEQMVPEIVVSAPVIGEETVHTFGAPCAEVFQRGAQKPPCIRLPLAQGEPAVGEGLLLEIPYAVQRDLLADGVSVHIRQQHGGAFGLVVCPAYRHLRAGCRTETAQRGRLDTLELCNGFPLFRVFRSAAGNDQQKAQCQKQYGNDFGMFHR